MNILRRSLLALFAAAPLAKAGNGDGERSIVVKRPPGYGFPVYDYDRRRGLALNERGAPTGYAGADVFISSAFLDKGIEVEISINGRRFRLENRGPRDSYFAPVDGWVDREIWKTNEEIQAEDRAFRGSGELKAAVARARARSGS